VLQESERRRIHLPALSTLSRPSLHSAQPRRFSLPHGACDAHCHVFGPAARFPFAAERPFTPADTPKEHLFALHAALGIERCVVVQSTCHGFDNRVVADAIASRGGTYCGVALAPVTVTDAELRRLHGQGFRGLRFNFMKHLGRASPIEEIIALTGRLAAMEWHLQVHLDSALIDELAPWLLRSATPVIIDHMARIDASLGLGQPAFRTLCRLMDDARIWVKVCGSDRISRQGPPYADAVPYASFLVDRFGDRTLWGTDWPHPNSDHVPDDGVLAELLWQIAPSEDLRRTLLVENPQRLYRFPVSPEIESRPERAPSTRAP
jgi:2-pyrone-4,6-dicarboxylate lactonase